ncbi:tyrosine--tRNA ligase [Desulfoluna spongiiphila]|uniref:tyrosine--tRNA ligase n=1 Tax=Desulfoluna spongiiphila TaxID=419481 RepID=UPI001257DD71|nr:tyrosine--tRNA ligase [Desulfoluna spongiiphila]VVS93382.1 tyrosine-trna ligase bacterial-type type 1 [Desulfoluna spongiiphila]
MNVVESLRDRGFVDNTTHEEELISYLSTPGRRCYIGFDPTGSSLHVGHLVTVMALCHMQRSGHCPIALVGGGTGMIGDPSGKTEMRKMLTTETIEENKAGLRAQLSRFLDFSDEKAFLLDNADWLTGLEYIPFLREVGRHFSVNRMIKAESYRARIDSDEGLSFIEFNYMLLQAYDFYELSRTHNCYLQMGGSDQWGNIVAGVELVRRKAGETAFGITFPLIMTAAGIKMGKTHKGAVWLDPERTSPYDYYQFWVNTDDADVERFLALFTFLPMEEVRQVAGLSGADLNNAKAVLAFEATALCHGREAALEAYKSAAAMFGVKKIDASLLASSGIPRGDDGSALDAVPSLELEASTFEGEGMPAFKLFAQAGLAQSGGAARKLIQQGGAYVNGERLTAFDRPITRADFEGGEILLRAGKKRYLRVVMAG